MGAFGGSGSSKIIGDITIDRARMTSYLTLIKKTMHLSYTVFELWQVICRKFYLFIDLIIKAKGHTGHLHCSKMYT